MSKTKRWRIENTNREIAAQLQAALKIHPVLCNLLAQRGIADYEEAKAFFRPDLSQLIDPWLLKDMQKAVDRILQAFGSGEKILVYGDYDVDGTTSVACMYKFLRRHYEAVDFYIPHRYREGYGISKAGIDLAIEQGFTLIIALDCGIKSTELIAYAKQAGIDFIVCDHHTPDDELPVAAAILNPKQIDCAYPFKDLCGCGVGFKLISALCQQMKLPPEEAFEYLDLVATAIAADIVSMTGENRVIAYFGLKKANENPNAGIKALCELSGLKEEIHINNLVFMIAPRVNAAGRMDDAKKAVQLFISDTPEEALLWAEQLHTDNTHRREADSSITDEALALIGSDDEQLKRVSTVVYQPHWHKGVVGIVASRLIEHYYRPTIVLTQSGDYVAGSARSVHGFNVYDAVHKCKDLLLGYGGHFYAAGMTMEPENVEAFCKKFDEVVRASIDVEMLVPEILIDAELNFTDINITFYRIICQMEPFGPGNLRPTFITRNTSDTGHSKVVKEKHLKFSLRQNGLVFSGIGFGLADKIDIVKSGKPIDIVYKIDENEWNGNRSLQFKVLDVKVSTSPSS
jgi:single-stranded-DNA-specific exonuclease